MEIDVERSIAIDSLIELDIDALVFSLISLASSSDIEADIELDIDCDIDWLVLADID